MKKYKKQKRETLLNMVKPMLKRVESFSSTSEPGLDKTVFNLFEGDFKYPFKPSK